MMKKIMREAGDTAGMTPENIMLALFDAALHLGFS